MSVCLLCVCCMCCVCCVCCVCVCGHGVSSNVLKSATGECPCGYEKNIISGTHKLTHTNTEHHTITEPHKHKFEHAHLDGCFFRTQTKTTSTGCLQGGTNPWRCGVKVTQAAHKRMRFKDCVYNLCIRLLTTHISSDTVCDQ